MTKDIERVALAIAKDDPFIADMLRADDLRLTARAAISALLPPSDAMVEAAARAEHRKDQAMRPWLMEWEMRDPAAVSMHFDRMHDALTAAINAALGAKP